MNNTLKDPITTSFVVEIEKIVLPATPIFPEVVGWNIKHYELDRPVMGLLICTAWSEPEALAEFRKIVQRLIDTKLYIVTNYTNTQAVFQVQNDGADFMGKDE